MSNRTYSYFELKRNKKYACSIDNENFCGRFEYKITKHYLSYRKRAEYYPNEKPRRWRGVWNVKWYDESIAQYKELK